MSDPTKAQKLASAMDGVISGSRDFNRQIAAQVRDELRSLNDNNNNLRAALKSAEERAEAAEDAKDRLRAERERDREALRGALNKAEEWLAFWSSHGAPSPSFPNHPERDDRSGGVTYGRIQAAQLWRDDLRARLAQDPEGR